jgi:hypothetical protein
MSGVNYADIQGDVGVDELKQSHKIVASLLANTTFFPYSTGDFFSSLPA